MSEKKASPFDFIKSVFESPSDDIQEGILKETDFNRYMFLRGMSLSPDSVLYADFFQTRGNIPDDLLFSVFHEVIQPKTRRYTKWPKSKQEIMKEQIIFICNLLTCSSETAIDIIQSFDDEDKKRFIEMMELDDKTQRKR